MNPNVILSIIVFLFAILLVGCGGSDESRVVNQVVYDDNSTALVFDMPLGFKDVAFVCNGSTGVYVRAYEGDMRLLPNDPECDKK